jgi:hypothetical protein
MSKNINQSQLYKELSIPPSRANIKVRGPLTSTVAVNSKFFQMGLSASDLDPIDWRNKVSLSPIMNQQDCGDCWAMSSTSALADRFIIQKWIANLVLDPAVTAQCGQEDSINQGCNGGEPFAAGKFFEQYGVPSVDKNCQGWRKICPAKGDCILPTCDFLNSQCQNATLYFAKSDSTENLTVQDGTTIDVAATIANIKRELLNGPVVAAFFVPKDFMVSGAGYKWEATNGIYINGAYNKVLHNKISNTVKGKLGVESQEQWGDIIMENGSPAGHAVSIVGWGRGNAGSYGDVSYWIVRNSWGSKWNEKGFFRIAMNDSGLNSTLGFDIPITTLTIASTGQTRSLGGLFGGCVAFAPDINTGAPKGTTYPGTQHSKSWTIILVIVIICIILLGLVVLYISRAKKSQPSNLGLNLTPPLVSTMSY